MTPETTVTIASENLTHIHSEHCDHEPKPKPQVLTRKQLGQLRRQFITVVHGTVRACGHKAKFDTGRQPGNNCTDCWTAYFMSGDSKGKPYVDLDAVYKVLTEKGAKGLEKVYGTKFMRNFHGFLATILRNGATKQEGN